MSQAPCELFWLRSGATPPPETPILPISICRLAKSSTLFMPGAPRVKSDAQMTAIGPIHGHDLRRLIQFFRRHIRQVGTLDQRGYSSRLALSSSKPSVRSSMNFESSQPFSRMMRIRPLSNAVSAPRL